MDKQEEYWKAIEYAVLNRDFKLLMRKYWGLYYTINPYKHKKAKERVEQAERLLTPEEISEKSHQLAQLFKVD
jgi:hypothetical protein